MRYATTIFLLLLFCACVRLSPPPETNTQPKVVRSIAILPVGVMTESGAPPSPKIAKAMEEGAAVLDQIVDEALTANPKIRLLSKEEVDAHSQSYSATPLAQALAIGKAVKAEAVMVWGLVRYQERTGGDYSVQAPASVGFQYRLIHTESGQTLCAASFEETQQSASDNLLAFNTLAKRGFKWVPASVLLREGVNKKIPDCQYLKAPIDKEDEEQPVPDEASKDSSLPAATEPATSEKAAISSPSATQPLPPDVSSLPREVVAPPPALDQAIDVRAKEISQFLDKWCESWEATAGLHGEMELYGAFYAVDFKNANQNRELWLADKTKKNRLKEWIRLNVSDLRINEAMHGPLLEISFTQEYTSSNYSERSRKTLVLRKDATSWEIVSER